MFFVVLCVFRVFSLTDVEIDCRLTRDRRLYICSAKLPWASLTRTETRTSKALSLKLHLRPRRPVRHRTCPTQHRDKADSLGCYQYQILTQAQHQQLSIPHRSTNNKTTNTNTNTNNNEKTNTTHPHRQFTPQQKVQLAQEYHDYESMDRLHEAKIKVLRDRQERRLQDSIARTEKELDDMIGLHARNFAALRQEHRREEARLLQVLDGERAKMRWRWGVEEAVLRRRLEGRHQVVFGPLPEVSFEGGHGHGSGGGGDVRDETRDSAICVSGDEYNAKMVANADANPDADANANANANAAGGDGKSQEESTESSASTPGPTPQQ